MIHKKWRNRRSGLLMVDSTTHALLWRLSLKCIKAEQCILFIVVNICKYMYIIYSFDIVSVLFYYICIEPVNVCNSLIMEAVLCTWHNMMYIFVYIVMIFREYWSSIHSIYHTSIIALSRHEEWGHPYCLRPLYYIWIHSCFDLYQIL